MAVQDDASTPATPDLVLATRNAGKLAELQQLVAGTPALESFTIASVAQFAELEDVVESGVTFEENALLKARYVAKELNVPAVADDSGLSVDVLGGCPGVFSARWSGGHGDDEANIALLQAQLGDVPAERLTAGFVCCVALVLPDGTEILHHGRMVGRITRNRRGTGGFGYDPIVELPDGRTVAELDDGEKNKISHRGQAFRALLPDLVRLLANSRG